MENYENNTNLETIEYTTDVVPANDANYASCNRSSGLKTAGKAAGLVLLGVLGKWAFDKVKEAWDKSRDEKKQKIRVAAEEKKPETAAEEVKEEKK